MPAFYHTRATLERPRATDRTFEVVASTETPDSHGSILRSNWRLDRYQRNPVVLFAHRRDEIPIGRAEHVRVERKALRAKIRLAANARANEVLEAINDGSLRGISVGFMPGGIGVSKVDGRELVIVDAPELTELSIVPVGSNPDALLQRGEADIETASFIGLTSAQLVELRRLDPEACERALRAREVARQRGHHFAI